MVLQRCNTHRDCRKCNSWYLKAKANGKRCASLYWVIQKIIEKSGDTIVINDGVNLNNIIQNLRDQPAEESDIKGNCVICFEDFNSTIHKPVAFQCGHVMCMSCVASGLLEKCPKCSKRIEKVIPLFL